MDGTTIFVLLVCVYGIAWSLWQMWEERRRCDLCGGLTGHKLKCPDSPYYLLDMMAKGEPWGWQPCRDAADLRRMLRRLDHMLRYF